MTVKEAAGVLGLTGSEELREIKRAYRLLMHRVHPDSGKGESYPYTVAQINEAYSLILKNGGLQNSGNSGDERKTPHVNRKKKMWNAPVNPFAVSERVIYIHAEDAEGEPIGVIRAAVGKYYWCPEEEFPLFLKSLCHLAENLISAAEFEKNRTLPESRRLAKTESLLYLLSCQFIDTEEAMERLAVTEEDQDGRKIYRVRAMLERTVGDPVPKPGTALYPLKLQNHRLYVCDEKRNKSGYLSFPDDRLYFVIIPILENRRVQVKISMAEDQPRGRKYKNVILRLRTENEQAGGFPEDINGKIRSLLQDI